MEGFFGNIFLKLSYQYIYIYMIFLMHFSDKFEKFFYSFISFIYYNIILFDFFNVAFESILPKVTKGGRHLF
jgi:hypothetical protein